jgi:non-canonical purine NTP pyrophosphatase (RdgB/HAM1 family)
MAFEKQYFFITGNAGKALEAKRFFSSVEIVNLDLEEIQSMEINEVIAHKLAQARKSLPQGNIFVEDTGLYFEALNGFPGPLIKWYLSCLKNEGIYQTLSTLGNVKVEAKTVVGLGLESGEQLFFEGVSKGIIVSPKKTEIGFGWDDIFQPEGSLKTFSQMPLDEKFQYSMRAKAFSKMQEHLLFT